jgi:hypothetical protein
VAQSVSPEFKPQYCKKKEKRKKIKLREQYKIRKLNMLPTSYTHSSGHDIETTTIQTYKFMQTQETRDQN